MKIGTAILGTAKLGRAVKPIVNGAALGYNFSGKWGPSFSFTRASALSVYDHENVLRTAKANELPIEGARRVENLLAGPTDTLATEVVPVVIGSKYLFSREGSGNVLFSGAATGSMFGVAGQRKVTSTLTATTTSLTITVSGSVTNALLERVDGQADQTIPSEYVSSGVLSSPYHGYGVDSVKYYETSNGNSVNASVVTYGLGAALTTTRGVLLSPATTNLCTYSDALNSWTDSNGANTPTQDTGEASDGRVILDTLTGDGVNADHGKYLTATVAAATKYNLAIEFRAGTSTLFRLGLYDGTSVWHGYIDVAVSGGVPSTSASSGATNIRYELIRTGLYKISFNLTTTATAVGQIHIHPDRNSGVGTVIVGGVQLTEGHGINPLIRTTGSTATITAPTFQTTDVKGVVFEDEGMLIFDWTPTKDAVEYPASSNGLLSITGTSIYGLYIHATLHRASFYDGVNLVSVTTAQYPVKGVRQKVLVKYYSNVLKIFINGVLEVTGTYKGSLAATPTGLYLNAVVAHNFLLHELSFYPEVLSDAECLRLSNV